MSKRSTLESPTVEFKSQRRTLGTLDTNSGLLKGCSQELTGTSGHCVIEGTHHFNPRYRRGGSWLKSPRNWLPLLKTLRLEDAHLSRLGPIPWPKKCTRVSELAVRCFAKYNSLVGTHLCRAPMGWKASRCHRDSCREIRNLITHGYEHNSMPTCIISQPRSYTVHTVEVRKTTPCTYPTVKPHLLVRPAFDGSAAALSFYAPGQK